MKLKFSKGNRKLQALASEFGIPKSHVVGFDLPAGHTCPFADACLTFADKNTGIQTVGENNQFKCFASNIESAFTNTRKAHWHNYDLLNGLPVYKMVKLINDSLPQNVKVVRIHASGDFFCNDYFNAWCQVASINPEIVFYGYSKGLQYVKADKPENFKLVYSWGGKLDSKVTPDVPVSYVVNSQAQAVKLGLALPCEIADAGDYFSILNQKSFALVLHGTQPRTAHGYTP
jgi:hypothetical protein